MFPLGESTLALDEEMLQVLDAADPVKPSASAFAPSRSVAPVTDNKRENERAPQPAGPHRAPGTQEKDCVRNGDCKRPGWRSDCKDLAQRLLFSEDSEEAEHAQKGPENIQSSPASACINGSSGQERKKRQQVGSSTK